MRHAGLTLTALLAALAAQALADEPKPGQKPPTVPPKAADGDAPLPEGWPAATKPGSIEVKRYPAYRSAVARAKGASANADNVLFFSLFNHISRKEIAMTAPVVNTYEPSVLQDPKARGEISMEFLYRQPTQGEAARPAPQAAFRSNHLDAAAGAALAVDHLAALLRAHAAEEADGAGASGIRTDLPSDSQMILS